MTSVQPPEDLKKMAYAAANKTYNELQHSNVVTFAIVDAVLATLFDACEVSEQWSVRWYIDNDGGYEEQDCDDNMRETAQQRARRLAATPPVGVIRGEALRRLTLTTPPEPC